jgi:hypothetical protein
MPSIFFNNVLYFAAVLPPLFLWLLTLCSTTWQTAYGANVVDGFPRIPNAFAAANAGGAAVRAIYEATQLTSTDAASGALTPLQSSGYVLCQNSEAAAGSTDANTAALVASWCTSGLGGRLISQSVNWSTIAAPGLQLLDQSTNSYRGRAWDCLTYACDTENTIDWTTTDTAPAALGGLSVGTPCCGSTNSTFVLYNTRGLVVQADMLPVTALNQEALLLAEAYAAAQAAPAAATSSSSSFSVNLTSSMDYCLLRQLMPSAYGTNVDGVSSTTNPVGDGGLVLPVDVAICGEDVSDRIDTRHASLAMTGYTLVLSTADGLDQLSFPKELIESIAAWVARAAGTAAGTHSAANSLIRTKGLCTWRHSAGYVTAYRTGDYYDCTLPDSALLQHLPPLLLSVRNESIVDTAETNSSCSIALGLAPCVVTTAAGAKRLRFFSTGSLMAELKRRGAGMVALRDPPIVVGVQQLRGATVAVTRTAYVAKWSSAGFNLAMGLPLLYLAVPRGTAVADHFSAVSWYACVQPQTCKTRQLFYPSLNRCATKECVDIFIYHFNPDTFECTVQVSLVSLFAAMCFALLVAEATVLYLRRSTDQAKEAHMRLVLAVQRRDANAQ